MRYHIHFSESNESQKQLCMRDEYPVITVFGRNTYPGTHYHTALGFEDHRFGSELLVYVAVVYTKV